MVEPYLMVDRGEHRSYSHTTWTATAASGLIPPAEYLIMGGPDYPEAFWVPFADAVGVLGPALTPAVGYDPPRGRHQGWPDPRTMSALRDIASPPR